jgi:hypothetical protein
LAEQARTTTKEMTCGESNGGTKGANIKVEFVALLTCDETAHMLLAREEKGWALVMDGSLRCYDLHNVLLTLTDPQSFEEQQ